MKELENREFLLEIQNNLLPFFQKKVWLSLAIVGCFIFPKSLVGQKNQPSDKELYVEDRINTLLQEQNHIRKELANHQAQEKLIITSLQSLQHQSNLPQNKVNSLHLSEIKLVIARIQAIQKILLQSSTGLLSTSKYRLTNYEKHWLLLILRKDISDIHQMYATQQQNDEASARETQKKIEQSEYEEQRVVLQKNQARLFQQLQDNQQILEDLLATQEQYQRQRKLAALFEAKSESHFLQGQLPLPVQGKVIQRFGKFRLSRSHRSKGIMIETPPKANVSSIALGKVSFVNSLAGLNKVVIIDHGHDHFSVYGLLEKVQVKEGEYVNQGSVIGKGVTNPKTLRPNLFFELRVNQQSVDPQQWVVAGWRNYDGVR